MSFKRVLCPVDFSDSSTRALNFAQQLCLDSQAELLLVHAFGMPASYDAPGQREPANPAIKEQLQQFGPIDPQLKVRRALHAGPPGEVICWMAEHEKCDLIVMGTHGRTGLAHLLLGSVAQHVLRHARTPVVVVRDVPSDEPPPREPLVMPLPPPQWM